MAEADDDGHNLSIVPALEKPDIDDYDEDTYNRLIAAEFLLTKGEYQYIARVLGRKRDSDENSIGKHHPNSILDTTIHEVKFPDGTIRDYAANMIAKKHYTHKGPDGNRWLLLKEIIAHEKDSSALSIDQLKKLQKLYTTKE